MEQRTVVKVRIMGEEYTLRTEASPEHTRVVAEHVDRTIRAILSGSSTMETHKAAILAALQITDDLFRERGAREELTAEMRQLAADMGVEAEFVPTSWSQVIPDLIDRHLDVIATGLWITPARALVVNFTDATNASKAASCAAILSGGPWSLKLHASWPCGAMTPSMRAGD